MGVRIRTIISDNIAKRCDGCGQVIDGTPWRVNLLDIVAAETPVSWAARPAINPGPFQFHGDAACVRLWMAERDYLFCRRGEVREIMRPVPIPGLDGGASQRPDDDADGGDGAAGDRGRWGLCDGIHRDDHEFVPA